MAVGEGKSDREAPRVVEGTDFNRVEKALLNDFQRDFPLVSQPYAALAGHLCVNEDTVIETLGRLLARGLVSRVGAVVTPHTAGTSTFNRGEMAPG